MRNMKDVGMPPMEAGSGLDDDKRQIMSKYLQDTVGAGPDLKRQELMQQAQNAGPSGWQKALMAIGAGLTKRDMGSAVGSLYADQERAKQDLAQYDQKKMRDQQLARQAKQDKRADEMYNLEKTQALGEIERSKVLNDPNSIESKTLQGVASKMMPGRDFSNMPAAKIQQLLPTLSEAKKYEYEQNENRNKKRRENIKQATDLRKEFSKNPIVKDTMEVQQAFGKIQKAANDVSAAGDLALVFNYMKMLDPTSTVRESEFANAQNSAGVPEVVRAKFNQIQRGERLSQKQREDFLNQSENFYDSQVEQYSRVADRYAELADRYGVDKEEVVYDPFDFTMVKITDGNQTAMVRNGKDLDEALSEGWEIVKQ